MGEGVDEMNVMALMGFMVGFVTSGLSVCLVGLCDGNLRACSVGIACGLAFGIVMVIAEKM
jgi:hypothetical protein